MRRDVTESLLIGTHSLASSGEVPQDGASSQLADACCIVGSSACLDGFPPPTLMEVIRNQTSKQAS